ncbi:homeobox protein DBX2 isoform X2 [Amblyraja radiata]|uniref:homeobox protein DBX2 isoform X2 n=1 Tax=Amblyraja radiata TaxID=386614 RepID=UPI0014036FE4|nr:homeobox protein DBX2 isoform X2 [Amblyraja radiata]
MLPSLIPTPSVSWQVLGPPQLPALHNLGKSFLIDNLLRINGPLNPPLRPIPANPVPVKVAQTAEQIGPSGGPHPTRSSFQLVNPSDNQPAPVTSTSQTVTYPDIVSSSFRSCEFPLWPQVSHNKVRRGILRRVVFSEEQRKSLEKTFQKQKYISKTDRKKLATHLGLKDSQVKIWFQNRRMKWRNTKERELLTQGYSLEHTLQEKRLSTTDSNNGIANDPDRKSTHLDQSPTCKYTALTSMSQSSQSGENRVPDVKVEILKTSPHSHSILHDKYI